jgi:hypothetical protein
VQLPVNFKVKTRADVFLRGHEQMVMRPAVPVELQDENEIDEERLENVRSEGVKPLRCFLPRGHIARESDREKADMPEPVEFDELEDIFTERVDAPPLGCGGTNSAVLGAVVTS